MSSFFDQADVFRKKWEGGLSDNKSDPGGITKYGVSLRFLRASGHDVDGDGDIDADDIRALTPEDATALLRQEFWTCQDLDSFSGLTAIVHYDASLNCGRGRAVRCLQAACNAFDGPPIKEDGRLGPKTRARVASLDDELLALRSIQERQDFYKRLVAQKPALAEFMDGWTNRTLDLIAYVQEVAHAAAPGPKLAPAQIESPAPVLQANGQGVAGEKGPSVVQGLRGLVSTTDGLRICGLRISKRLSVLGVAVAIVSYAKQLGIDLTPEQIIKFLSEPTAVYILMQSIVEICKPLPSALIPYLQEFFRQYAQTAEFQRQVKKFNARIAEQTAKVGK